MKKLNSKSKPYNTNLLYEKSKPKKKKKVINGRVKLPGWRLDIELAEQNSVFGEKSRQ